MDTTYLDISWMANSLRLTVFVDPLTKVNDDLWGTITEEVPEKVISLPKTNKLHIEGPFKNGKLNLDFEPFRIDWIYTPIEDFIKGSNIIGPFLTSLEDFSTLMGKWFASGKCPEAKRIAFGASLIYPINSRDEGYKILAKCIPSYSFDIVNISDFHYQINRPRKSKSDLVDIKINRLTKWGLLRQTFQSFQIPISEGSIQSTGDTIGLYTILELDINTSPDFDSVFSSDQIQIMFNELQELGKEIAMKGDIK